MTPPLLFINQLTNLDFSYLDVSRGLVGETWLADIILSAPLDASGMVMDFGRVKPLLKRTLESVIDHKLLVPADSPNLQWQEEGNMVSLTFTDHRGQLWQHQSPADAVVRIPGAYVTADQARALLIQQVTPHLPPGMNLQLQLRPETIPGAYYHYSHGLKKHDGDCQRIAHGHRSPIRIMIEGKRDESWEKTWADRWKDIYIGSREDLIAQTQNDDLNYYRFAYQASQGSFQLTLPANRCYLIDSDSTVELIAQHIAAETSRELGGKRVQVVAYEGYQKGAIATVG